MLPVADQCHSHEENLLLESKLDTEDVMKSKTEEDCLINREYEENADTNGISYKYKVIKTVIVFIAFIGHGAANAVYGVSLVELQQRLDVNIQIISTIFAWRYVGGLCGSLFAGQIVHLVNQHIVQGIILFCRSLLLGIVPWCSEITLLSAVVVGEGCCYGMYSVAGSSFLVNIWGEKNRTFLQGSQMLNMVGSALAPLLVNAFTMTHLVHSSMDPPPTGN